MKARAPQSGDDPRTDLLVALFAAAMMLFNFPLLALWNVPATVFGLPVLPVALFAIWAALIAVLVWVMERGGRSAAPPPDAQASPPETARHSDSGRDPP